MNFLLSCFEKPVLVDEEEIIIQDENMNEKAGLFSFHKVSRFSNPAVDEKIKVSSQSVFENKKLSVIHFYNGG